MHMNEMLERMNIDDIIEHVTGLGGVLTLQPQSGDGTPEISWGDVFFYYAPDGQLPKGQPFATIVTKDYPDDEGSRLNRPDTFRLNFFAGKEAFISWTGHEPREPTPRDADPSVADYPIPANDDAIKTIQLIVSYVQQAIEAPRFGTFNYPESFWPHTYRPGRLNLEARIPREIGEELVERGHDLEWWPEWTRIAGNVCAIRVDHERGTLEAGADARAEAYAAGW